MVRRLRKPEGWPRYMRAKRLGCGRVSYYWEAPHWSRSYYYAPAVYAKALGLDFAEAKRECDDLLNPGFDAWRRVKDLSDEQRKKLFAEQADERVVPGTVRWLAREFEKSKEFTSIGEHTQAHYREGLELICEFKLRKDQRGRLFGDLTLASIDADVVDALLEALNEHPDGGTRARRVYKAMQAMRRAWFVMARRRSKLVPALNPFSKTGLKAPRDGASQEATLSDLHAFMKVAEERGHPSMAAAAMIAWEWMLREIDIVERLSWSHYRSIKRPQEVRLIHGKNNEDVRMPLSTSDGSLLFPELEERLARLPRRGSLMVMRDVPDRLRGGYLPFKINKFQKLARELLDAVDLQHLNFESFRKGGETECGDADLTDQQIMALDGHRTRDMLTIYAARNRRQRIQGMLKRRATRTNAA